MIKAKGSDKVNVVFASLSITNQCSYISYVSENLGAKIVLCNDIL